MQSVFDQIGGEPAVRALVERFYDLVETQPEGAQILHLHLLGHGMAHVRAEQFDFMSGFLGGRRLYAENHGHMNLREIHAHVPIRAIDAENWLHCMSCALVDTGVASGPQTQIMATLGRAARMLVNQAS
jgi:hemoglobin